MNAGVLLYTEMYGVAAGFRRLKAEGRTTIAAQTEETKKLGRARDNRLWHPENIANTATNSSIKDKETQHPDDKRIFAIPRTMLAASRSHA